MTRIILNGCSGHMGRVIARLAEGKPDCEIVCGIDIVNDNTLPFPVFSSSAEVNVEADAIIDFSHPSCLIPLLDFAAEKKIPAVICTTGLSVEQKNYMYDISKRTAVFFSANMSLGVNLIAGLAKKATTVLEDNYDIEIVEAHHNRKLDAPSGTALYIADCINHSIRGGTIVGEHTVIFAGNDEIIEIKHTAMSREIFAEGSLAAAVFMNGKESGMYDMNDLINSK